jgi:hypothetical protein
LKDLIWKIPNTKKGWWSGSSDRVLSECEVLSSNPKGKKKRKQKSQIAKKVVQTGRDLTFVVLCRAI